jgi:hypothetical protein
MPKLQATMQVINFVSQFGEFMPLHSLQLVSASQAFPLE